MCCGSSNCRACAVGVAGECGAARHAGAYPCQWGNLTGTQRRPAADRSIPRVRSLNTDGECSGCVLGHVRGLGVTRVVERPVLVVLRASPFDGAHYENRRLIGGSTKPSRHSQSSEISSAGCGNLDQNATQCYRCVMIPQFDADGLLPPGIHRAHWDEVVGRFGTSPWRQQLLAGLRMALDSLSRAGCQTVYIAVVS